ncbi:MAG TPA: carbon starvation CstA family protein [Steroidobacteraceae bacterium]|nr:carbon starvation CstA family protein [Steroidobacteraceae bacterium]
MSLDRLRQVALWAGIAVLGAAALGGIALNRGETINAAWFVVAAACVYLVAYRFYAAWIAARVFALDATRATPAERLENGRDFVPTNRWIVFGHHFAAIAGAGPLVGPTLAAQFGYLPGTLWLIVGAVLGGCVQDMLIMFCSTRRNGRGLGQMARDELGAVGGTAALVGTVTIITILIAVLGLVVVKAMAHSPWSSFTVFATIPIALLVGVYLRHIRPGRVLEATAIGVTLLLLSVVAGGWIDAQPALSDAFDLDGRKLAWFVILYGFVAAILPVWLLLAPRDYLSTFVKLGVVVLLAIAVCVLNPDVKMPALTRFIDGTGPIFSGTLFPFLFITLACGAISGFHSLVSSGTTPKLIANETDIPLIGYGSMAFESFVGVLALVAACVLDPGVYFAINSAAGVVGADAQTAVATISSWGFPVTTEQMNALARSVGEQTLFARTGGAPSLAVGMASIFGSAFGAGLLAVWYHFAIMFEAVFIMTTIDAGTRVGRFIVQDVLGRIWEPLGRTSWYPSVVMSSLLIVAGWGYFLYVGVIDPNGGINILWPLFGIANQLLAAIALCVGTTILVTSGRLRYAWISAVPLAWLVVVTTTASLQKILSDDPKLGFFAAASDLAAKLAAGVLPPERAAVAPQLIFNQQLDGWLTGVFLALVWIIVIDTLQRCIRHIGAGAPAMSSEVPYVPTQLA